MKFMEIKNLGLCLVTVLFFHLHLVSTASSPYPFSPPALNREQYVKDKPLMENLPSRVGKEISVSRRGGGGGHGGGGHGGGGRGGRGSRRGGGAAAAIIPLYAGGASMNQHKTSHHSGSNNTGSPKAIFMLLTWLWLSCLFFFLYI